MINHHFFRVFAVVFAVWVLLLVGFKSRIVLAHRYECEFRTFVEFPRNGSLWYLTSIRSSEMRDRCLIGPEPLSTSFPIPFHVNPHFVPEVSFYVCFGNKKTIITTFPDSQVIIPVHPRCNPIVSLEQCATFYTPLHTAFGEFPWHASFIPSPSRTQSPLLITPSEWMNDLFSPKREQNRRNFWILRFSWMLQLQK